ncbi:hypothetical protein M9H77_10882 [Catharanthus roseus]|uniref:Uncharacterized protein n=1 Tax=Catharanthus roseus TaxID=4058 RepID=A0ACC0BD21_CATRO|nr:hypothetical protein M9H77_10882 [Catharanthus roseus]
MGIEMWDVRRLQELKDKLNDIPNPFVGSNLAGSAHEIDEPTRAKKGPLQNGRLHIYRDLREKGLGMFPSLIFSLKIKHHKFKPQNEAPHLSPKFKLQIEAPNLRHIPTIYQVIFLWLLSQLLDVLVCLTGSHQLPSIKIISQELPGAGDLMEADEIHSIELLFLRLLDFLEGFGYYGMKGSSGRLILERLDRCFFNSQWLNLFLGDTISHLPRMSSDHYPILLKLILDHVVNSNPRPFRMLLPWFKQPNFGQFVQEQWGSDGVDFMDMVKYFTLATREWHRNVFGNIVWKKKKFGSSVIYTLNLLEKANQTSLWGDTKTSSKLHIISWVKICQRKDKGGLGLHSLKNVNRISLARSAWRLLIHRNQLWARVLDKLCLVVPTPLDSSEDKPRWKLASNELFTLKSVHQQCVSFLSANQKSWEQVWKFSIPLRFLLYPKILLASRGMDIAPYCHLCGRLESDAYVLRDCVDTTSFLKFLIPIQMKRAFFDEADVG